MLSFMRLAYKEYEKKNMKVSSFEIPFVRACKESPVHQTFISQI